MSNRKFAIFVCVVIWMIGTGAACFIADKRAIKRETLTITTVTKTVKVFKNLENENTLVYVSDRFWSKDYHTTDNRLTSCLQEIQFDSIDYEANIDKKNGPVIADVMTIQVINGYGEIIKEKKIARVYRQW